MAGSIDFNTQSVAALQVKPLRAPSPEPKKAEETGQDTDKLKKAAEETPAPSKGDLVKTEGAKALLINRDLSFSVDQESGKVIAKVTDGETGKVIRVIPSEDVTKTHELVGAPTGLLVDAAS